MTLLIEAGGMRSSESLSSSTAPVSASSTSACFAWVSIPPTIDGTGAVNAFSLGCTSFPAAADFVLAAKPGEAPGMPRSAATATAAAIW